MYISHNILKALCIAILEFTNTHISFRCIYSVGMLSLSLPIRIDHLDVYTV